MTVAPCAARLRRGRPVAVETGSQTRLPVFRPVTVDAIITRTAATMMATIQRTQSMPALPLPPKAE